MADKDNDYFLMRFNGLEANTIVSAITTYMRQYKVSKSQKLTFKRLLNGFQSGRPSIDPKSSRLILEAMEFCTEHDQIQDVPLWKDARGKIEYYENYAKQMSQSPQQILNKLNKAKRMADHSFVRESLDMLFGGIVINNKKATRMPLTLLSIIALNVVKKPYVKNDCALQFFIINSILTGAEYALDPSHHVKHPDITDRELRYDIKHYKHLKAKGYKYMIISTNKGSGRLEFRHVKKNDVDWIVARAKEHVSNITE